MTLDTYGHVLTGAQMVAADKLDAIFGGSPVAVGASNAPPPSDRKTPNPLRDGRFRLVEMWGLEPQTPYMRSMLAFSTDFRRCPKTLMV